MPKAERIIILDILRGFSLLGIMFVNVSALQSPADFFYVDWSDITPWSYGIKVAGLILIQGKFYSLFAFLFGVGFAIQIASSKRSKRRFIVCFLCRLLVLFVIGLLHFVFVWDGDILSIYAICGFILLIFYGATAFVGEVVNLLNLFCRTHFRLPSLLLIAVAGTLIIWPLCEFGYTVIQDCDIAHAWLGTHEIDEHAVEQRSRTTGMFANGSYEDTVHYRLDILHSRIINSHLWSIITGIFLIGVFFGRCCLFSRAKELKRVFIKLAITALAVSIPFNLLFVFATINLADNAPPLWFWLSTVGKTIGGLALALFYIAMITLANMTKPHKWFRHLAPVGRMALTNYLTQSLVGTFVFYGYGMGLTTISPFKQIGYIAVLFGAQVVVSHFWFKLFIIGPAEWLWRSLSHMKRQPFLV
jgi:uncharacterized protein